MKLILVLLFIPMAFASKVPENKKLPLSRAIFKTSQEAFISHQGPKEFDTYLTQELPFAPAAELYKQLLLNKRSQLANLGEAHITVVSPIEFWEHLRHKQVTMDEIDNIAKEANIQDAQFSVVCLGRVEKFLVDRTQYAYYLVVRSEQLLEIRRKVRDLFVSKGGDPALFVPEKWYPHVTIGFSARDLHESDGVYKSEDTCHLGIHTK